LAPFLAIYHDFFADSEIESFIGDARGNLARSTHHDKLKTSSSSVKRTSKQVNAPLDIFYNYCIMTSF